MELFENTPEDSLLLVESNDEINKAVRKLMEYKEQKESNEGGQGMSRKLIVLNILSVAITTGVIYYILSAAFGAGEIANTVTSNKENIAAIRGQILTSEQNIRNDISALKMELFTYISKEIRSVYVHYAMINGYTKKSEPHLTVAGNEFIEREPKLKKAILTMYEEDKTILPEHIFDKLDEHGCDLTVLKNIAERNDVDLYVLTGIIVAFANEQYIKHNPPPKP